MNDFFFMAGAGVYALLFWLLCRRRPNLALMLIFALSPFQQDISGGGRLKFSIAEVNLLLSLPLVFQRKRRWRFGPTVWPAMAFMLVGLGCSLLSWRDASLTCLVQTAIYLVLAVLAFGSLARTTADYQLAINGFIVVGLFLAVCICASGSGYVLGLQKNGAGASMAAALLMAMEMSFQARRGRWYYQAAMVALTAALVLTLSRGAWMSALTGAFVILILRRRVGQMLQVAVVVAVIAAAAWMWLPAEAKDYALGFSEDRWNIKLRYESQEFAKEQFTNSPVVGVGMGLRKEYDATNLILLTLAETGVVGLVTFAILHLVFAAMIWRAQRLVKRTELDFSVLAIASALIMGKLVHGMVDHYWSRGPLMAAWGAVGMAVFASQTARARRRLARARRLQQWAAMPATPALEAVGERA